MLVGPVVNFQLSIFATIIPVFWIQTWQKLKTRWGLASFESNVNHNLQNKFRRAWTWQLRPENRRKKIQWGHLSFITLSLDVMWTRQSVNTWSISFLLQNDRNAVSSSWPTLEIPYIISPDIGKHSMCIKDHWIFEKSVLLPLCFSASRTDDILSAMEMVSKHTCVSFHKRTIEQNYLLFKTSTGYVVFWSSVS